MCIGEQLTAVRVALITLLCSRDRARRLRLTTYDTRFSGVQSLNSIRAQQMHCVRIFGTYTNTQTRPPFISSWRKPFDLARVKQAVVASLICSTSEIQAVRVIFSFVMVWRIIHQYVHMCAIDDVMPRRRLLKTPAHADTYCAIFDRFRYCVRRLFREQIISNVIVPAATGQVYARLPR